MRALLSNIRRDFPDRFVRDIRPVLDFAGRNWVVLSIGAVALGVFLLFRQVFAQNAALATRCSDLEARLKIIEDAAVKKDDLTAAISENAEFRPLVKRVDDIAKEANAIFERRTKEQERLSRLIEVLHNFKIRIEGIEEKVGIHGTAMEELATFRDLILFDREILRSLISHFDFSKLLADHRVLALREGSRKNTPFPLTN